MELKEIEEQIKDAVYDGDATYRQILERIMIAVQSYGQSQYNQATVDAAKCVPSSVGYLEQLDIQKQILNLKKH